jgi:hypothetical protein
MVHLILGINFSFEALNLLFLQNECYVNIILKIIVNFIIYIERSKSIFIVLTLV